jgi:hypothetical protein
MDITQRPRAPVTCAVCGKTFVPAWSEAEAIAERERLWPGHAAEECDVLCDDCMEKFMKWFHTDEITMPPTKP